MTEQVDKILIEEEKDSFDSYFDCITECYWLGGEDVECVQRCVSVHLNNEG